MIKNYFLFLLLIISYTSCTSTLEDEQMIEEEMMDGKDEEEILITEYSVDHYKSLTGLYTYDKEVVGTPCRDRAKELSREYARVSNFYFAPKRGYTATITFHNHLCMPQDEFAFLVDDHMETLNTFYNVRQMEDSRNCEPITGVVFQMLGTRLERQMEHVMK